jgi:O-antigen ligase
VTNKKNLFLNFAILGLIFVAPLSTALTNIFVGLVILLWIIEGNFKEKFQKLKTIDKALLFFILIYILEFISLLWSDNIYSGGYWSGYYNNAIDFLLRHEFFYLIILIIVYTSFKKEWTDNAINIFIYAMLLSEIISYGIILGIWTTERGTQADPSPFLNHSAYSALLAWTIFLLIEKGIYSKKLLEKLIYFLFSFTATLNLLFNTGRTGQIIFFVLLVFYLIEKFHFKLKTLLISFVLIVSIFFGNYFFNSTFKHRMNQAYNDIVLITKGNYASSWGLRYLSIILSERVLKESLLFGYGFSDAKKEVFKDLRKFDKKTVFLYKKQLNGDMHNQYLQFFNEIGLIGLFFLILTFYFYFKINFDPKIKIFAHLFMIDYIFMFFTGCFLRMESTFILFIIFMTIFVLNKNNSLNNNYLNKEVIPNS